MLDLGRKKQKLKPRMNADARGLKNKFKQSGER